MRAVRAGGDRGSALITVIAISAVIAMVCATMVATVSFATGVSSQARGAVQAQATAEHAIDATLSQMSSYTYGSEGSFPCSLPYSEVTGSGAASAIVTIRYRSQGAAALACPVPSSLTVVEAELTAVATVQLPAGEGSDSVTRTVKQRLSVDDVAPGGSVFDYGVYAAENLAAQPDFKVDGGGVYTNGTYTCNTNGTIIGDLVAGGDVRLTNGCLVDNIEAGGIFHCDSNPHVRGNVTAAGTGETTLTSTCRVDGNVVTAGKITMSSGPSVGGNVISAGSSITVTNASVKVGGYGRAGTSVVNGFGGNLNAVFGSGYAQNSPSAAPSAPEKETMPSLTFDDVNTAGWAQKTFGSWIKESAVANGAPSYSTSYSGTQCLADSGGYAMNGGLTAITTPTVVDARGCSTATVQAMTMTLRADLTLVVNNFSVINSLTVNNPTGGRAKLRIVVPAAPGAATCAPSTPSATKGNIALTNTVKIASNVDTFVYTNGTVSVSNDVYMTGSLYSCKLDAARGFRLTYADMTPPGMEGPAQGTYDWTQTARYNLYDS